MEGFVIFVLIPLKCVENYLDAILRVLGYNIALMIAVENSCAKNVGFFTGIPRVYKQIPHLSGENRRTVVFDGCILIVVDCIDDLIGLLSFEHPRQAFYIFDTDVRLHELGGNR